MTFRSSYSNVAVCVSLMFDLPPFSTKMPPLDDTRFGQPRPSIQRVVIEHVNAHVAHDAVPILHESPPPADVREPVVRPQRGRAGPHFVVEKFGHRDSRRIAVRPHVVIAANIDLRDLAEQAGLDDVLLRFDQMRACFRCVPTCTTRLCLRAAATIASPSSTSRLIGFCNRRRPPPRRPRSSAGVPMVGRADEHDVEILLLEHLAIVAVSRGVFFDFCRWATISAAPFSMLLSTSQSDHDLDRRHLNQPQEIDLAVPPRADQADAIRLRSAAA